MNYWLIKSEPFKYNWDELVKDKSTCWDGIRNYAARLNLLSMKKGDKAFFYHSNEGLEIVGIAEIIKEAYQDPTTEDERWVAVDVKADRTLKNPVTLAAMKDKKGLENMDLIRISRLSVGKVSKKEWEIVLKMSGEK